MTQPRLEWKTPRGQLHPGPLAVRVLGRGRPILLLHGLLGSNQYWGSAFDRLSDDRLLLVPDLLGFGASPRPVSGYGPEDHARALLAMLEQLQVTERALVVGHSLGALLAIWMAFKHPDRVRGVIAFGPPLFRDARHAHRQIANLGGFERLFASDHRAANWLAKTMCRNLCSARPRLAAKLFSLARPHLPYPLAEDATRHSWIAYSQTLRQVILAAEGAQWLGATRLPIRLVAGGQDRYLDLDFLKELAGRNTHLQVDVWPDDGHDLPLLLPDRCMATISSWRSDEITTAQSRLDTDSDH